MDARETFPIPLKYGYLYEQVAYKRAGLAGPNAKVTFVFWTQALSHSLRGYSYQKNIIKQYDAYGCNGDIFAFREFKLTKRSRPQRV